MNIRKIISCLIPVFLVGCVQQPTIKGSKVAKDACDASTEILSGDFSLNDLPGVWLVNDSQQINLLRPHVSFSEESEDTVKREYYSWLDSQRNGQVGSEYKFSVGVSTEQVSQKKLDTIANRRSLHADYARVMAYGDLIDQIESDLIYRQKSTDQGTALHEARNSAEALFGTLELKERESYIDGRYQYAVLAAWSPDIEQLYKGVALGCLGKSSNRKKWSESLVKKLIRKAVSDAKSQGIPTGGQKIVISNGVVGYLGFGAYPIGNSPESYSKAKQIAEMQSRGNALRTIFSELLISYDMKGNLDVSEGDFSSRQEINDKFNSRLRGIRLPGVYKLSESTVKDPMTGIDNYFVVTGFFPQSSDKNASALRSIIVERFKDEAKKVGVK